MTPCVAADRKLLPLKSDLRMITGFPEKSKRNRQKKGREVEFSTPLPEYYCGFSVSGGRSRRTIRPHSTAPTAPARAKMPL